MGRVVTFMLALLLLLTVSVPAAGAADLTTEQKFQVLKQQDIFAGFSDGSSGLYQSMTREQFAQVLYKLLDLQVPNRSPSFADVPKNRWSFRPIQAVAYAGLMVGVGGKKFGPESPVTVEQLAAILVRSYGITGNGNVFVVGKTSSWATSSVAIALQRALIPQMKNYTVSATRGLLVEAVYAVYTQSLVNPLQVIAVQPLSNQTLRAYLSQPVTSVDKDRFMLRDVLGIEVFIRQISVSDNGLTLTLVTDRQVANRSYSLFVDGVAQAQPYTAMADDETKPYVASFNRLQNSLLEIIFSEPVDRGTATKASNYSLNNDLKMTAIQLSSDSRKVTISTSRQYEGTTYRLTIRNIKDLAGNVMDTWSDDFNADTSNPKASFAFNSSTARITLTFNEKINPQQAVNTGRYSIDKGVYVTRAELDSDGRTVRLTTSAQKDATVYTLTVSGIADLAGNVMDPQSFEFGGVANPVQPIQLQSVQAVDQNTLEAAFSRALTDDDVNRLGVAVLTDNGNTVSMTGWQAFKLGKSDNKRVTVQFKTTASSNPDLFRAGHVYTVRVTGIPNLVTANNADEMTFAGTQTDNRAPYVTQVVPLTASTVKVLFSEPVKNVSEAAFMVREKDGASVSITDDGVGNSSKIVTELVLKFGENLQAGHEYVMTFRAGTITDAAGWNGWQTKDGTDDFFITFRGV